MDAITIKNNQVISKNLPKGFTFDNHVISIKDKMIYDEPIKITLKDDNNENLVINIGKSSEVKLIFEINSKDLNKNNYDLTLNIDKNSQVNYLVISDLASSNATLNHTFNLEKDVNLKLLGGFVSNIINSNMHVKLNGENSSVDVKIIAISSSTNNQRIDVLAEHFAKNSYSDMTNIGVVNEKGKVTLNGVAKIHKGMNGVSAFQSLKGITTSDDANLEVNPILLIEEHDIKAGHGATIGKLEKEVLFYLMSRGLNKTAAENLVIMGLLNPVISEIDDEPLKERFLEMVNKRLWSMF